jgi:hypothetical protein
MGCVSTRSPQRNKSVELYAGCLGPTVSSKRIDALIEVIDRVTGTGTLLPQRQHGKSWDGTTATPSR